MAIQQRWEQRSEAALTGVALVFLVAYSIPIIWPGLNQGTQSALAAVVLVTWALFGVDYVSRLVLADDRRTFFVHHLFDLLVLALPILRPLRLLRLITLLTVLSRTGSQGLRGRVVTYAVGGTGLLILCGALAITDAERLRPGSTINTFGDGLWWAVTTVTTVGYGDTVPITAVGRIVAGVLMIAGIGLLGVVTATLASWLVERVSEANEVQQSATRAQVQELAAQIARLEGLLHDSVLRTDSAQLLGREPKVDGPAVVD